VDKLSRPIGREGEGVSVFESRIQSGDDSAREGRAELAPRARRLRVVLLLSLACWTPILIALAYALYR